MSAVHAKSASNSRGSRRLWTIVFVVALCVLVVSAGALAVIGWSYYQGQQKYEHIATLAGHDKEQVAEDADTVSIDWDALLAVNPDTVGWITIPGSTVDYPVVHTTDNSFYLSNDFERQQGWLAMYGAIFLDYLNAGDFSDACNFIYGHHMNDGSMFAPLAEVPNAASFEKLATAYLYTPQSTMELQAFAYVHCAADEEIVVKDFASDEERLDYINSMIARSEYQVSGAPVPASIKKIVALSTCDDTYFTTGRYITFYAVVSSEPLS